MNNLEERLSRAVPRLFWGSLLTGLTLPWLLHILVQVFSRSRSSSQAFGDLSMNLFAPGYNYFLIGAWNGSAYVVYAVIVLFAVGRAHVRGPQVALRRLTGAQLALVAMLAVNAWADISIMTSRSSTAAIGYLFVPATTLVAAGLGCVVGRLMGGWIERMRAVGTGSR
jgi:hypothetical protein